MKKKVVIAMSGGVDSSLSAYILQKQNYDVIGITMTLSDGKDQNVLDAKKVADFLNIPFHVVDYKKEFNEFIIDYFCKEYTLGKTPNPCIVCNRIIKFGLLLDKAKELGCSHIATGHYARVEYDDWKKRFLLKKGIDQNKDQSYFLFSLSQEQLSSIIFPLGLYKKDDVKKIAKEIGLPTHSREESQEICFVNDNNYSNFLKSRGICQGFNEGVLKYNNGKNAGKHTGIANYTIGQRKGIGAHQTKHYVIGIDAEKNTIIIDEEKGLYKKECFVKNLNWIDRVKLEESLKIKARIRYRHIEDDAEIFPQDDGSVKVVFDKVQRAITPGQGMVFYNGDIVIGGGWIQ